MVKSPARRILRRGRLHETNTRNMVLHTEPSDPSAAAAEFRATLSMLGIPQCRAAAWFGIAARSLRRWGRTRRTPRSVSILCHLMVMGAVTIEQVKEAAIQTNDSSTKPEPPAPRRAARAPEEQPTSARAPTATLVGPSPTTTVVEQVCMLTAENCHWPLGVPGQPGFRFCGSAVVTAPYCPRHRAAAYLPRRTSGGHSVRIVHGRHGRPPIPGAATGAAQAPKVLFDRSGDLPGSAPC